MATIVIFGGSGFIGSHLTESLLQDNPEHMIVLFDLNPPRVASYTKLAQQALAKGNAIAIQGDVRLPITHSQLPAKADLIINLAAVHREPGHKPQEYYETNLLGAENVCAYAERVQCRHMVFTSSISPYGPSEECKTLPVPATPYGGSKLVAEKIHIAWGKAGPNRQLLIMRPGVVYGPGEGGNVTRMVRSIVKGYFVYLGNQATRKAGGYVKELCAVITFGLEYQGRTGESLTLLNFSFHPTPRMERYVEAISSAAGIRRHPLSIPRFMLMGISYPVDMLSKLLGIHQPVNPVRVRKLFHSTYIEAARLSDLKYPWKYTMEEAFRDWKRDLPEDFE